MRKLAKPPTKAYLNALRELYGSDPSKCIKKNKIEPRASNAPTTPTEAQEQARFATWLDKQHILYYAIPNGGSRHYLEAINLKRGGVKAGVPDICVPIARKGRYGLYIELKRVKGGKISEEQEVWLTKLQENGYSAQVAYGCDEAKGIVIDYLGMKD